MHRLLLLFLFLPLAPLLGQGTQADYERSDRMWSLGRGKVFRDKIAPTWSGDGKRMWYRVETGVGTFEFVSVDLAAKTRAPAFDHAKLAAALTKAGGKGVRADALPVRRLTVTAAAATFDALGKTWTFAGGELRESGKASPETPGETPVSLQRPKGRQGGRGESPDGKTRVAIRDNNVHLVDVASGKETQLTKDGTAADGYNGRVYWSPDGTRFVAMRTKAGKPRTIHLIESSPKGTTVPKLHEMRYDKPGEVLSVTKPRLFDAKGKEIVVKDDLFANPWSLDGIRWDADSSRFTFEFNQRGHGVLRVVAVDAKTGAATAVVDEVSKTFVDYAGKRYLHRIGDAELIWMSERDGWNHLYLYDAKAGKVKAQITRGEWVVRGVESSDDKSRRLILRVGGIHPKQDPYHVHYLAVGYDGSNPVILTEGDGTHSVVFSPDGKYIIDTYSRVDLPPVTEVRDAATGKLVAALEKADIAELKKSPWTMPERFVAKGRDGKTDIHGVIFRPSNFDPKKRYPVIEEIYAGPHSAFVPKSFRPVHYPQPMAELGFVVVKMDGMGTSHRSKAFHDVCWKNLGDSGFPDRIAWIKAAAAKYPYLDLSRVGIYGGSAGGQSSTRAMLAHGDFYKVAVSDCGCHDNRVDKIWWNELWMSWPIGPHYAEQSNVTNAHKLTGKLMLVVGEMDRNVDPASTLQVADALIKANKDFDLLFIPGAGHGAAESPYGQRRRKDFFVRHLLGVEPRAK